MLVFGVSFFLLSWTRRWRLFHQPGSASARHFRDRSSAQRWGGGLLTSENGKGGRFTSDEVETFDPRSPGVSRSQMRDAVERLRKKVGLLQKVNADLEATANRLEIEGCTTTTESSSLVGAAPSGAAGSLLKKPASALSPVGACPSGWRLLQGSTDAHTDVENIRGKGPRGMSNMARFNGEEAPQNVTDSFRVWLCLDSSDKMSGLFQVKRLACRSCRLYTRNPAWAQMVNNITGPDEFEFLLYGPEIHELSMDSRYLGDCTYNLPFRISIPATYRVEFWSQASRCARVDELNPRWLPGNDDDVLGSRVSIVLGDPSNAVHKWQALMNGTDEKSRPLASCDFSERPSEFGDGRWVYSKRPSAGNFTRAAMYGSIQDEFTWVPWRCHIPTYSKGAAKSCLEGKSVSLWGDSHMRQLYNAIVTYACGADAPRGQWHQDSCSTGSKACPRLKVCVFNDPFGKRLPEELRVRSGALRDEADLIISNFGQHPADGAHQWTSQMYNDSLQKYAHALQSNSGSAAVISSGTYLWHETNDHPFNNGGWFRAYKDHRTSPLIRLWNILAKNKMESTNLRILPAYRSFRSRSYTKHQHMKTEILQASVVQFILNTLCPAH
ncbi:unnamed protein product [Amoebophrya sp. A25]|nr:unnamed protein product [Amoebophrya sp. A25]|eukprot:GSA25T00027163001.1